MADEKTLTLVLTAGECRALGAIMDFAWREGGFRDETLALLSMTIRKKIVDAAKEAGAIKDGGTDAAG